MAVTLGGGGRTTARRPSTAPSSTALTTRLTNANLVEWLVVSAGTRRWLLEATDTAYAAGIAMNGGPGMSVADILLQVRTSRECIG